MSSADAHLADAAALRRIAELCTEAARLFTRLNPNPRTGHHYDFCADWLDKKAADATRWAATEERAGRLQQADAYAEALAKTL